MSTEILCEECCEHSLKWHHESRGCGYHGFSTDRCPCLLPFDEALADHDAKVEARALLNAADEYTNNVGGTKARPHARTWLRERAARVVPNMGGTS